MEIEQIKQSLQSTPDEIYKTEKKEVENLVEWKSAKVRHEKELSFALINAEGNNATEKKANAILCEEVKNERRKEIKAEANYKLSVAKRKRLERRFEALRSLLSLEKKLINQDYQF